MIDGRTVMEVDPKGKSAAEVAELWDYVADRLEKNFRRTIFSAPGGLSPHAVPRPAARGFGRRVSGRKAGGACDEGAKYNTLARVVLDCHPVPAQARKRPTTPQQHLCREGQH